MIEPEKPLKMKEQIRLNEELAFKLQAEEEEQARLVREKAEKVKEANISWDNVQEMIKADMLLAERFQAREQEELTDEEKAILFVELLEKRKKHFAALRAQEKRNKPPTKAQKKSTMSTYLKHMASYKQTEAEMAQESSSKRAGEKLEQEVAKKQKMEDDKEKEDLKNNCSEIFDREGLENLWKLVKAKHGNTRPKEGYERVLWGDLKTMFEHHVEDLIWRNLQGMKVLLWRLYDSCGIHFVRLIQAKQDQFYWDQQKYSELSATEAIQADCDVKATNIILQGLPPEVYVLVSNHRIVKELWKIIQLLMQGTSLTKQERGCKLYDELDKFDYKMGETLLPVFKQGDDPIDAINHMMSFLSDVVTSHYPITNNQGRQIFFATGTTRTYTPRVSRINSGKQRTIICYNCKGEGHMSKQSTKPKRKQDDSWFKDKVLLVQAQASGQILYEEELAFLADTGILESQATQTVIALMANLSHYGSDVLVEVHNPDDMDNNMINQSVQAISSSE
ncbi:hypothetical protein Tco_0911454 [Tanacetum coccineum]|uniref:Uncharacterized protein n=1 Tax=Tanacetum coccineum TaxID=301880 RepID=A0ABQ5D2Z2_9ASTR